MRIQKILAILTLLTSCNPNLEVQIQILNISEQEFDYAKVFVYDRTGKIAEGQIKPTGESRISIPQKAQDIKLEVEAFRSGSKVARGQSTFFNPKAKFIKVVLAPFHPYPFPILPLDEFFRAIFFENSVFVFTEGGRIIKVSVADWSTKTVGTFSPRRNFAVFLLKDKIAIAGGRELAGLSDKLEVFDPETNQTYLAGKLPVPLENPRALSWNDKAILVLENGLCIIVTPEVEVFSVVCMEGERRNFEAEILRAGRDFAEILISGGETEDGKLALSHIARIRVSPDGFRSEILPVTALLRRNHKVVKLFDTVYIFGGDNGKREVPDCEILLPDSRTASIVGEMNFPRIDFSAVKFFGRVIVVGGQKLNGVSVREIEVMEDCFFKRTEFKTVFRKVGKNCALNISNAYVLLMCFPFPTEIFALSRDVF